MAIAYDNAFDGGGGTAPSSSISCTVGSGSNRIMFTWVSGMTATGQISSVTYNGVAMTSLGYVQSPAPDSKYNYLYYLYAPDSGTHNVVVTMTSSVYFEFCGAVYSGVSQSGFPDASTTNTGSSVTSITTSVTTVADNCWTVIGGRSNNNLSASTGMTLRSSGGVKYIFGDSNGAKTPAGSTSMAMTLASGSVGTFMASFAPPGATTGNFFMFM